MELSGVFFSQAWLWGLALILLPAYWYAIRWADVARLREQSLFNAYLGSVVFLLVLWTLRTDIQDGIYWHLSGMVFLTLMWGWSLAIIGGALVLLGVTLSGMNDWGGFLPSLLLAVLIPASATQIVLGLVRAYLPKHFFVYVFVNAFFCGGLVAVLVNISAVLMLFLGGDVAWSRLQSDLLVLVPLMIFPEGFINGMITTVLVGMRPHWVWSFHDDEYLQGR